MRPTPRPYQVDVIREAIRQWYYGHQRLLVQLPTGAGKTVIAAEIVARAGTNRVLYVVPSEEIFEQTAEKLEAVGIKPLRLTAGVRPPLGNARCVLAMAMTLQNRLQEGLFDKWDPGLVIADECHRLLDQHYTTLRHFSRAKAMGMTATAIRLDGRSMEDLWPMLIQGPPMSKMRAVGALVPVRTLELPLIDPSRLKVKAGDFDQTQLSRAFDNAHAAYLAALYWVQNARGRKTIAFCPSVKVSQTLADALKVIGVRAEHLDGQSSPRRRAEVLAALEAGELELVTNCGLFVEGLDITSISCILVCTSTLSMAKWLQMCGRGMRPSPGKTDLLVIDHGLCRRRLGDAGADRDWSRGGAPYSLLSAS
jgi:superfamily II DNA or RNA helicase